jgi:hypothetical protein
VIRAALRFEAVLRFLDGLFLEASATSDSVHKEVLLSYVVIKLHDQWNFRSRQIIHLSYGKSQAKMMNYLRRNWSPRKNMNKSWEPDWHIPGNTIRAGRLLNIPNLAKVQNALGAGIYVDDIRWTRNAIVHNIPLSYGKFRSMCLRRYFVRNISPSDLPLEINPVSGNTIYQD